MWGLGPLLHLRIFAVCSCLVHSLSTRHLRHRPPRCYTMMPLVPPGFPSSFNNGILSVPHQSSHSTIPRPRRPTAKSHFRMCQLSVSFCFVLPAPAASRYSQKPFFTWPGKTPAGIKVCEGLCVRRKRGGRGGEDTLNKIIMSIRMSYQIKCISFKFFI